jgi:hypothetical protein
MNTVLEKITPYHTAKTFLSDQGFKRIDIPLTKEPEITWYVKDPFAVGVKKVTVCAGGLELHTYDVIDCTFLYGNFFYGYNGLIGIQILSKVSQTLKTITPVIDFIECLPHDMALAINIDWAKPLIEAYLISQPTTTCNRPQCGVKGIK